MKSRKPTTDAEMEKLQRESFTYLLLETNPANGLVIDKTAADWPGSIAATGLALGQRGEVDHIGVWPSRTECGRPWREPIFSVPRLPEKTLCPSIP